MTERQEQGKLGWGARKESTSLRNRHKVQGPRIEAGGRWMPLQPDSVDVSMLQPFSHRGANKARGAAADIARDWETGAVCTFQCSHLINLVPLQSF